ncbi:MAG: sugar ABC transporter permease [Oscillospiraceae bacterium]
MNRQDRKLNKRHGLMERKYNVGYWFIAPFLLGFVAFMLLSLVQSCYFAFSDIQLTQSGYDVIPQGIEHFRFLFLEDVQYRVLLFDSLKGVLWDTVVILPFSFFVALILSSNFKGRAAARMVFFLPVILSTGVLMVSNEATNNVLNMVMSRSTSAAADVTTSALSSETFIQTLFANSLPPQAMAFVQQAIDRVYNIIIRSGLQIVIFIGGLNTISPSIYESSSIEGATSWVNFWKITFPMMGSYILLNLVYTIIDSFTNPSNMFMEKIKGDVMGLKNFGLASSAAWIYCLIVFVVLGLIFAFLSKKVFYYD